MMDGSPRPFSGSSSQNSSTFRRRARYGTRHSGSGTTGNDGGGSKSEDEAEDDAEQHDSGAPPVSAADAFQPETQPPIDDATQHGRGERSVQSAPWVRRNADTGDKKRRLKRLDGALRRHTWTGWPAEEEDFENDDNEAASFQMPIIAQLEARDASLDAIPERVQGLQTAVKLALFAPGVDPTIPGLARSDIAQIVYHQNDQRESGLCIRVEAMKSPTEPEERIVAASVLMLGPRFQHLLAQCKLFVGFPWETTPSPAKNTDEWLQNPDEGGTFTFTRTDNLLFLSGNPVKVAAQNMMESGVGLQFSSSTLMVDRLAGIVQRLNNRTLAPYILFRRISPLPRSLRIKELAAIPALLRGYFHLFQRMSATSIKMRAEEYLSRDRYKMGPTALWATLASDVRAGLDGIHESLYAEFKTRVTMNENIPRSISEILCWSTTFLPKKKFLRYNLPTDADDRKAIAKTAYKPRDSPAGLNLLELAANAGQDGPVYAQLKAQMPDGPGSSATRAERKAFEAAVDAYVERAARFATRSAQQLLLANESAMHLSDLFSRLAALPDGHAMPPARLLELFPLSGEVLDEALTQAKTVAGRLAADFAKRMLPEGKDKDGAYKLALAGAYPQYGALNELAYDQELTTPALMDFAFREGLLVKFAEHYNARLSALCVGAPEEFVESVFFKPSDSVEARRILYEYGFNATYLRPRK
ncbi:hypothetical protein OC842_004869 [Tilletia horrida]|uniref:Uncharacterized protein n=1 Tax=Tilletia horrida TaxID=155126 RepID=A0AAN6G919_9BASI|nr:hypothetical protein OC842_004869 [Tilletia horrida]